MIRKKPFRLLWLTTALAALILSVSGCSDSAPASSAEMAQSYAQSLYNSQIQYIGDNAAVSSLLSQLGVENRLGTFTIELETTEEPYGLILHFDQLPEDIDVFTDQFYYYADLLLALIDNCGQVSCTYPNGDALVNLIWTTQQAGDSLNVDLKSCAGSPEDVAALLDTIRTVYADNPNIMEFYQES